MFIKYYVRTQERPIGLKYDVLTQWFVLGGHASLVEDMYAVMKDFFAIDVQGKRLHKRVVSVNKMRFSCKLDYDKFSLGMSKLRDAGIDIVKTKTLGRVMR